MKKVVVSTSFRLFSGLLLTGSMLLAQTNRGSITGAVTDPSGAGVGGATVTAEETNSGTNYSTVSSASGGYGFPQVLVGSYDIKVTAPNFKTAERTGIVVQINTPTVLNVPLALGRTAETVTVVANSPTVQSSSSDIGAVVTPRQVEQLPLSLGGVGAFRSPEAFAFLMPGVVGPGTANSSNGIYIQKTSGGQNFGDDVILDGSPASRPDNNSTFDETAPSVDALQEFKVETATPPAQYGRTTGGIRSFTTHSGSNSFHGSAFDILRNTDLDSNTYFNGLGLNTCALGDAACRSLYGTPKDIKNDYGLTLGGPVIIPRLYNGKNKTFFFFVWEQLRWPRSSVATSTLPTAAERAGDFGAVLTGAQIGTNPCTGAAVLGGQIFDPASTSASLSGTPCRTSPYPNNRIPASQLNPVALKVLSYMPSPNLPGLTNNFSYNQAFPTTNTTYTIRVDQNLGTYDKIFASYSTRENALLTGGSPVLPAPLDPNTWNQDFVTHYGRFAWDHTFGPTLLNHLNLGYDRWNGGNYSAAATQNVNWPAQLGIANVNGVAFPQFNIGSSFPNLGQQRADDTISNLGDVSDTFTWAKRKHTISLGGDYR